MGPLLWFIAALLLAFLELLAGELTLLMLAVAALITAGISFVDIPLWAEALVFAGSAALTVFAVRPALKRHMVKPPVVDHSARSLVGSTAEITEPVGPATGQIKLGGDIWTARSLDPSHNFSVGETVRITAIDGNTAVVWKEN